MIKTINTFTPYSILDVHAVLALLKYHHQVTRYTDCKHLIEAMMNGIKHHAKKHPKDVYIYTEIGDTDYNGWCYYVGDGDPVMLRQYRNMRTPDTKQYFENSKLSYPLAKAKKRANFIKKDMYVHPTRYNCVSGYDETQFQLDNDFMQKHQIKVLNV